METTLHCSECGLEYIQDGQKYCTECGGEMTNEIDEFTDEDGDLK